MTLHQPAKALILPRGGTKFFPEGRVWDGVGLINAAKGGDCDRPKPITV